jgi:hypothetical protein
VAARLGDLFEERVQAHRPRRGRRVG